MCGGTPKGYADYRECLEKAPLDAVVVASPPHWHALHALAVCAAGKDLYLEKPMTLHVNESLAVRDAVRRHGVISQVGTQIHAGDNYRRVVELVRSGALGKVHTVRTLMVMNQGPEGIGRAQEQAPFPGLDWDFWCGPGPMRPFNPLIVDGAYNHCSFMDYSGGWTPGMAPHILDLPYWALELGHPTRVSTMGGRFVIDDAGDIPDTQEVQFQYPGCTLTWSMSLVNSYGFDFQGAGGIARRLGIYFQGANATLMSDYGEHRLVAEGDRFEDSGQETEEIPGSPGHQQEWLNCIRSRNQPSCCVDYHYRIDVACCLANLAYRLGRSVNFDPEAETIVDDKEAAALLSPVYREPWHFPKG
jgi:predicted dehydrogenase